MEEINGKSPREIVKELEGGDEVDVLGEIKVVKETGVSIDGQEVKFKDGSELSVPMDSESFLLFDEDAVDMIRGINVGDYISIFNERIEVTHEMAYRYVISYNSEEYVLKSLSGDKGVEIGLNNPGLIKEIKD
jgi:hypothetical protein